MRSRTLSRITPDGTYEKHEEIPDLGNIAAMAKEGVAPSLLGGDTYFFAGKGTLAQQFAGAEDQLDFIVARAKRNGYNPNPNDVYEGALARFPGDPAAFVPPSGGINHIKKVCEERDIACEGAYKRERTHKDPNPEKPFIDKKVYKRLARDIVKDDPSLAKKSKQEIKAAVYDKHAYKLGES